MSRVPWNFGGGPVSIRLRSPDHRAPRVRLGGLALECGAERRQVQVTVEPAELLAGLDHPGRDRGSDASAGLA